MNIKEVIDNIVTQLDGLSWTSQSGGGTTEFQELFSYKNYESDGGFPAVCVYDVSADAGTSGIYTFVLETTINIDFYIDWSVMEVSGDESLQREEAIVRLREMWDGLKSQIFTHSFENAIGADIILSPGYTFIPLDDINIYIYRVTSIIKEIIRR